MSRTIIKKDLPKVFVLQDIECPDHLLDAADRAVIEAGIAREQRWKSEELNDKPDLAETMVGIQAVTKARMLMIKRIAEASRKGSTVKAARPTGAKKGKRTGPGRRGAGSADTEGDLRRGMYPLTDLGNAERFTDRFGGTLMWSSELSWFAWDGRRWTREDGLTKAILSAYQVARHIQDEAKALAASDLDIVVTPATPRRGEVWLSQTVAQWGRRSEGKDRLHAIVNLASPMMAVRPDDLDADPMLLNVENGTIVIARPSPDVDDDLISIRPHDPVDRITKLAPVHFDPQASAPLFGQFMAEIQPEGAQRRFLRQWFGYSCIGHAAEQCLVFFYGRGSNGKSTLVDEMAKALGDYADTIPIESFLEQRSRRSGDKATPDLVDLKGVRMLRASEPENKAKLAEAFIKLVTGGEPIKVRDLNKSFFVMHPVFKLTISGNHRPDIKGSDDGIWRRMRLVPFTVKIPDDRKDTALSEKLAGERSGIFNWILDGLRDYLENGLVVPESIAAATQSYREDSDPLGRFLELCVREEAGGRVQSSELHRLFLAWAKAAGEREWSNKGLSSALKERGYRSKQSNVIYWLDIATTREPHDFAGAGDMPGPGDAARPFAKRDVGDD